MRHMRVFLLGIGIGLIGIIGCGSDGSGIVVAGKVTVGDKPVEGTIIFTGKGKEVVTAPIYPDGTYKIESVATGQNQITIKGLRPGTIPQKYATPQGNLNFDVKSGRNTKDFTLEP